jgi:hypothetical protein
MLTPEQDELLARMCGQKMHVHTIAAILLVTEDEVREAKKRLGLGRKPRAPAPPRPPRTDKMRSLRTDHIYSRSIPRTSPARPEYRASSDELAEHDRMIPASQRRRKLGELRDRECHWPIGDTRDPEHFYFCGGRTSSEREVYCDYHRTAATNNWRRAQ